MARFGALGHSTCCPRCFRRSLSTSERRQTDVADGVPTEGDRQFPVRLTPSSFWRSMARSACSTRWRGCSFSRLWEGTSTAMPKVAVTAISLPSNRVRISSILWRTRSASVCAPCSSVSRRRMANSSPPTRATTSAPRTIPCSTCATPRSTSSPAARGGELGSQPLAEVAPVVHAGERVAQRDLGEAALVVDLHLVRVGELESGGGADLYPVAVDEDALLRALSRDVGAVLAAEVAQHCLGAARLPAAVQARDALVVQADVRFLPAPDAHDASGRELVQLAEARAGEDQHERAFRQVTGCRRRYRDGRTRSRIAWLGHARRPLIAGAHETRGSVNSLPPPLPGGGTRVAVGRPRRSWSGGGENGRESAGRTGRCA